MTGPDPAALAALAEDASRRADEIEATRALPQDLADAMARAGVLRMSVPKAYHGSESHPGEIVDTLAMLGKADGSTGWIAMIGITTGLLSSSLAPEWAQRIYGDDPDVITCGVTAPMGRARPEADGWRVSGRWPFGSGGANSSWICGGCQLLDDSDGLRTDDRGNPVIKLLFFEAGDVQRHDNWLVSGLRGTGSSDFEVRDVHVPDARSVTLGGRARIDAPLYRFPTLGLLALGVAAVAVGIGEHAVDELVELAGGKVPTGSARPLARRAFVQADVAKARAALRASRAYMHDAIGGAWQSAERGDRLSVDQKAELRLAAVHATWSAAEAVDRCYHAGGGTSIYATSPLQRCFRDVHVATQHMMVAQPIWETTGRVAMGMEAGGLL